MTPIEALIVLKNGIKDSLSRKLFNEADQIINDEYNRIYLEAKKDQLQRELNEIEEKLKQSKLPF